MRHRIPVFATILVAFVVTTVSNVLAADGSWAPAAVTANAGTGTDIDIYGVGARWNLPRGNFLAAHELDLRLDVTAAYWRGMGRPTPYGHLWEFGVTPMLRRAWSTSGALHYYVEGGIGPHALTATRINNDRRFGIAFQLGSIVGAGLAFGARHQYELGLYVKHVSNANIATENWGLTYAGIVVRLVTP